MNCALRNDDSSNPETCDSCSVTAHCEIRAAFEKRSADDFVDALTAGRPDGTVKALLNKEQSIAIIVIKGNAQVANVMQLLGEAGTSILGKRFI